MAFIQPPNNFNRTPSRFKTPVNPIGYNKPETWSQTLQDGLKVASQALDSDKHFKGSYSRKSKRSASLTSLSAKKDSYESGRSRRPHKSKANKLGSEPYFPGKEQQTGNLTFTSGVKSGVVVNTLEASSVKNSLLFVQSGSLFPCHDWKENSLIKKLLLNDIFHSILTTIQADISYRSDRDFIDTKFYEHMCAICEGLQLYFFGDSILSYNSVTSNTNSGMLDLRRKFSADILSAHEELRRELLRYCMPPNLVKFIGYMYQNFKSIDAPNSPILRLAYNGVCHSGSSGELSKDVYTNIITKLRKNTRINSLLISAFPECMISELPASNALPIYDPNWLTFWYNSCITYVDKSTGSLKYTRSVNSTDQQIYYGHFCQNDDLDGIFYASSSIFNSAANTIQSGLYSPISDIGILTSTKDSENQSSLLCNLDGKFVCPKSARVLSQSLVFHGVYYNENTPAKFIDQALLDSSAQRVQTHSIEQLQQATSASTLFLFSGLI